MVRPVSSRYTGGMDTWVGVERRVGTERRDFSTWTLLQCATAPRRMWGRRRSDRHYPMLDRFDSGMVTLAVVLMLCSIADSIFTLMLLSRGGTELNPIMNLLLQQSVWAFTGVKMMLTAIPAILLVATGNMLLFNRWRARSLLGAMVGLYGGLIVYELLLLSAV